jgi:hypothetical protein
MKFQAFNGIIRLTEQRAISSKSSADCIGVIDGIAMTRKRE